MVTVKYPTFVNKDVLYIYIVRHRNAKIYI